MERKKVITFSDKFFSNLEEFGLDFNKAKQNILSHIEEKEKSIFIEANSIWDKGFNHEDIIVTETNIRIIK